jgi:hypothetical protein
VKFRVFWDVQPCSQAEVRKHNSGRQHVARGSHVALVTFICGQSHDLGISQCKKDENVLLPRNTVKNRYIYIVQA